MKKIIYIHQSLMTSQDIDRFGFKYFKKKNIVCKFINVSNFTRPKFFKKTNNKINFKIEKFFNSRNDIISEIKKIKKNEVFVFIDFIQNINILFILKILNSYNIKYGFFIYNVQPFIKKSFIELIRLGIIYPKAFFLSLLRNIQIKVIKKKFKPSYIFCAGKICFNNFSNFYKDAKVVKIPSFDCDNLILKKNININLKSKNYASFIEVNYRHSDQDNLLERFPPEKRCSYINYYTPINLFFKNFIKIKKIDLKIAGHPRNRYIKNPYNFAKIYYDRTFEIIRRSQFVFLFSSAAINYAVLLKKPMIFLTQKNFTYSNKRNINDISAFFNKKPIDMSSEDLTLSRIEKELHVDKQVYEKYKKYFITDLALKKTSSEIIYENLQSVDKYKN